MISLLVLIAVVLIVVGMLLWAVDTIPGIPEPPKSLIKAAIILIGVLYILYHGATS